MDEPDTIQEMPAFSCVIINYNGRDVLQQTLDSLERLDTPPSEYIVVDDGSTDDGLEFLKQHYPQIRIEPLPQNTGRTSIVRNAGIQCATHRFVLVTDNDISFHRSAVTALLDVMRSRPEAAACTPAVLFNDGSEEVFIFGHQMHCLCCSAAYRKEPLDVLQKRGPRQAVGGGIALLDKKKIKDIGFFNENLVIGWGDDGELHHRLRMMGLACFAVPDAMVYHNRIRTVPRIHGMIHNRLVFLGTNYQMSTLISLFPILVIFECLLLGYVVAAGKFREYTQAWRSVLRIRAQICRDRRRLQKMRTVRDRDLFVSGLPDLPSKSSKASMNALLNLAGNMLRIYWSMVKVIL
ncbi:glycosyltransferase family 2 protein [Ruegeria jejuensis]|uniref:glycosyltransferase family 2 protein n=1 Tax=Ruegeria jejuensis TaxID=3233338 RepID=UPI00355C49A7